MQRTSLIVALFLILLTVVFAIQNSAPVQIKFFFWEMNYSPAILVPIALLLGAVLGMLFSIPLLRKKNQRIKELEKTQDQEEIIE
jgi:uncharacterized integral membrane protein